MQETENIRKESSTLSSKRPPRILVVDDDGRLRDLLRQFLTNNGFHVSVAEDANQMNRLWMRERFDAVILDVMMPGEDGISILKRIRASNDNTPILMLTAKGEDIDRILGLEFGADDYLPKPYNPRELLAVCTPFCADANRLILRELRARKTKRFPSAISLLISVHAN